MALLLAPVEGWGPSAPLPYRGPFYIIFLVEAFLYIFSFFWNIRRPIWLKSLVTKMSKLYFDQKFSFLGFFIELLYLRPPYIFFLNFGTLVILLLVLFLFLIFLNCILYKISLFGDLVYKTLSMEASLFPFL